MTYRLFHANSEQQENRQTIVLLHGFISSGRYWKRLIPYLLSDGFDVLTIDLLGFGTARRVGPDAYGYEQQSEHIENCLKKSGVTSPFILIGHSMGALVSAYYAKQHPNCIAGLILLQPPIYLSSEQAWSVLHDTGVLYRFLLTSRYRNYAWALLKLLPGSISLHANEGREKSLEAIVLSDINASLLSSLMLSTLLVVGRHDRSIYQKNLKRLALSPNITLKIIDADHHAPRKQPKVINELIRSFLTSTPK